jgi:hypothetical protein
LIVANIVDFSANNGNVTDSQSNSYSHVTCAQDTSNGCIYYKYSPTNSSSLTVNAHLATFGAIQVLAFKGTTGSAVDQDSGQGGPGPASTCQVLASITPAANEVAVSSVSIFNNSITSVDSGMDGNKVTDSFTGGVNEGGGISYVISNGSAIQPTWTSSGSGYTPCTAASFQ